MQINIKLIEFLQNIGLIPSPRDHMPKNILLMLTKSVFENIKRGINWALSKTPSIQVLHQQIFFWGGVLVCADSADAGGVGGPKLWKTC